MDAGPTDDDPAPEPAVVRVPGFPPYCSLITPGEWGVMRVGPLVSPQASRCRSSLLAQYTDEAASVPLKPVTSLDTSDSAGDAAARGGIRSLLLSRAHQARVARVMGVL